MVETFTVTDAKVYVQLVKTLASYRHLVFDARNCVIICLCNETIDKVAYRTLTSPTEVSSN